MSDSFNPIATHEVKCGMMANGHIIFFITDERTDFGLPLRFDTATETFIPAFPSVIVDDAEVEINMDQMQWTSSHHGIAPTAVVDYIIHLMDTTTNEAHSDDVLNRIMIPMEYKDAIRKKRNPEPQ